MRASGGPKKDNAAAVKRPRKVEETPASAAAAGSQWEA